VSAIESIYCERLCASPHAAGLFARAGRLPWAVWLDSGGSDRWSIMAVSPRATVTVRGRVTEVAGAGGVRRSFEDPFAVVRAMLPSLPADTSLPFAGGAVGYCAYDLGRRINGLPMLSAGQGPEPDMAMGVYDTAVLHDHHAAECLLVGYGNDARARAVRSFWKEAAGAAGSAYGPGAFELTRPLLPVLERARYVRAVERIKRYIYAGDCYQVNFAQPFRARISGDPLALYGRLRERARAPFGAYLNLPFAQVLSASPERFLEVVGDAVETQPIKGTRPRADDPAADAAYASALRESPKDRAENLMIVDLLRNDLGRVCRTGSISVPALFELRSYSNVHHLVSTVRGQLRNDADAWDALAACFPGGSITGAPKRRAMEIIDELECRPRGVYCGAIGYCSAHGAMDMNIAIRTMVHRRGEVQVWGGGGIVADSDPEAEYRESLDKTSGFRAVLS